MILSLLLVFLAGAVPAPADSPLTVSGFSPEGTVKDVREVRAQFSGDVIAFGDPRGPGDPFTVECPVPGHGRWADAKNWVYDFDRDLPGGLKCTFRLKPGFPTVSGTPITGQSEYAFDTGGPAIKRSEPWEGSAVDEEQIFVLTLDAPVDPGTIARNAYFAVEGIPDRIGLRVLDDDPRKDYARGGISSKIKLWAHKFGLPTRIGTRRTGVAEVLVQARQKFPANAAVTLVWGAGIATPGGAATTKEQAMAFRVRPNFEADFTCERENAQAACLPITAMRLQFNAPVAWSLARQIRLQAKGGGQWKPVEDKAHPKADDEGVESVTFPSPVPERTQFQIVLPRGFQDDAGRTLFNATRFPLDVATADFPPLVKFPAEFGILELHPEAVLPVTVRNVEPELVTRRLVPVGGTAGKVARLGAEQFGEAVDWIRHVERHHRDTSVFAGSSLKVDAVRLPKPNGDRAFEVIGIPLKDPGLYVVELESERLGSSLLEHPGPMYVPTVALVTDLAVHFKQGRESSLVWVTTLAGGKPVADAAVGVRTCDGKVLQSGVTDAHGIWRYSGELSGHDKSCRAGDEYSEYDSGLFVTAEKGGDFSFVHSSWHKGIESWRFNFPGGYTLTPDYASTVFDRTLFRAGETVHMKHFFRHHGSDGMGLVTRELPKAVQIRHQESNQTYELPLQWRAGGVAESVWSIPKGAKLGTYAVTLLAEPSEADATGNEATSPGATTHGFHHARRQLPRRHRDTESWASGEFRVEEYRVPLMRGQIAVSSNEPVQPRELGVDLSVQYLSGGAASKLGVALRQQTSVLPATEFPAFDGYTFAAGKVRAPDGATDGLAPGEEELDVNPDTPQATTGPAGAGKASKQSLELDARGTAHAVVAIAAKNTDQLRNLQIEMDYRDPNGETQTVSRSVTLYPSSRLVGVKPDSWFATKKSLKFQLAVADLHGKAVAGAPVEANFVELVTYSHRKRLVGGLYAYENKAELKPRGKACSGVTDEKGLFACDTVPPVAGNLMIEAKTTDGEGHTDYSNASTWVYDSDEWWFSQEDSDRIDLLPEHKRYEIGETAKFQARMPFREATALVTVEREGVLDAFVVPVSGSKPLIEVPIKPSYAPNVYVSVLVVRGRVGDVQPTSLVDLGKPAYKLGIGEINVGWKPHELKVTVQPSKDVYQVREKASFRIHVETASGEIPPAGSEVALAAVDEGLLQLKPNDSWKLLEAMMSRRGYEVETYTAQSEVIGKRHFGMKALNPGGDGGRSPARELFDTLLFWNGAVHLDAHGDAEVQFPMNDSITGFRIAAVAHAGSSLFGTGYATVHTTQDLMLFSGVPPLAREGDHLALELTLRNTTKKAMRVAVKGQAAGLADFSPAEVALPPGDSQVVRWTVDIPAGVRSITYAISAKDRNGSASDALKVTQQVAPAVPVRVFQATLTQVDGSFKTEVQQPADALAGRGEVRVTLDPTLLTGLDGVRDYMGDYPYICLEQRVSKAIALRDEKLWKAVVGDLPSYLDGDGLARYFPTDWLRGSDILTSYLLAVSQEAGWDIPSQTRERLLGGLIAFVQGKITRLGDLPTADLTVRKIAAVEALSRYGLASWVMLAPLEAQPNLWPTSALIDWDLLLHRLRDVPDAATRLHQADQILRSRLNFQGTMMGFSTENVDELWWMMVSTSVNANRFLLAVLEDPAWKGDMGRLARGALYRQREGHWDTTTANAWGVLAIEKFARAFEKTPVSGQTQVALGGSGRALLSWSDLPTGKSFSLPWPPAKAQLEIAHSGDGRPWATIQSLAAIPLRGPLGTGYRIHKQVTAVEQKAAGSWSKGDIARVTLDLESQSDMTWVVVNDPIPAGSTILGSGLGNDSSIASGGEKAEGWAEPAFQERAFDGFRAYYQFVPKGKWSIQYTVRFNQSGHMGLPPTRVEAMYAPEMFGETPNADVTIAE